jgi:exodeoxyribonuclease VII small subunit
MSDRTKVNDPSSPESELSFEKELENLERVVDLLERGELGLEEAIRQYESGARSLKRCHQALERAQKKVEVLTQSDPVRTGYRPPEGTAASRPPGIEGVALVWREEEVSALDAEDPADSRASD